MAGVKLPTDYVIPRAKISSAGEIKTLESGSREEYDILSQIRHSFLDQKYTFISSDWKYNYTQLIKNRVLAENYSRKRQEIRAKHSTDCVEKYAFMFIEPKHVDDVCMTGKALCTDFNHILGPPLSGINLCRHADVCMRWAGHRFEGPMRDSYETLKLVVYKILVDSVHHVPVRTSHNCPLFDPSPFHNIHMPREQPHHEQSLFDAVDLSQIYLYEYDDDGLPSHMPSNCLPFALVTFRRREYSPWKSAPSAVKVVTPAETGETTKTKEGKLTQTARKKATKKHKIKQQTRKNNSLAMLKKKKAVRKKLLKLCDDKRRKSESKMDEGKGVNEGLCRRNEDQPTLSTPEVRSHDRISSSSECDQEPQEDLTSPDFVTVSKSELPRYVESLSPCKGHQALMHTSPCKELGDSTDGLQKTLQSVDAGSRTTPLFDRAGDKTVHKGLAVPENPEQPCDTESRPCDIADITDSDTEESTGVADQLMQERSNSFLVSLRRALKRAWTVRKRRKLCSISSSEEQVQSDKRPKLDLEDSENQKNTPDSIGLAMHKTVLKEQGNPEIIGSDECINEKTRKMYAGCSTPDKPPHLEHQGISPVNVQPTTCHSTPDKPPTLERQKSLTSERIVNTAQLSSAVLEINFVSPPKDVREPQGSQVEKHRSSLSPDVRKNLFLSADQIGETCGTKYMLIPLESDCNQKTESKRIANLGCLSRHPKIIPLEPLPEELQLPDPRLPVKSSDTRKLPPKRDEPTFQRVIQEKIIQPSQCCCQSLTPMLDKLIEMARKRKQNTQKDIRAHSVKQEPVIISSDEDPIILDCSDDNESCSDCFITSEGPTKIPISSAPPNLPRQGIAETCTNGKSQYMLPEQECPKRTQNEVMVDDKLVSLIKKESFEQDSLIEDNMGKTQPDDKHHPIPECKESVKQTSQTYRSDSEKKSSGIALTSKSCLSTQDDGIEPKSPQNSSSAEGCTAACNTPSQTKSQTSKVRSSPSAFNYPSSVKRNEMVLESRCITGVTNSNLETNADPTTSEDQDRGPQSPDMSSKSEETAVQTTDVTIRYAAGQQEMDSQIPNVAGDNLETEQKPNLRIVDPINKRYDCVAVKQSAQSRKNSPEEISHEIENGTDRMPVMSTHSDSSETHCDVLDKSELNMTTSEQPAVEKSSVEEQVRAAQSFLLKCRPDVNSQLQTLRKEIKKSRYFLSQVQDLQQSIESDSCESGIDDMADIVNNAKVLHGKIERLETKLKRTVLIADLEKRRRQFCQVSSKILQDATETEHEGITCSRVDQLNLCEINNNVTETQKHDDCTKMAPQNHSKKPTKADPEMPKSQTDKGKDGLQKKRRPSNTEMYARKSSKCNGTMKSKECVKEDCPKTEIDARQTARDDEDVKIEKKEQKRISELQKDGVGHRNEDKRKAHANNSMTDVNHRTKKVVTNKEHKKTAALLKDGSHDKRCGGHDSTKIEKTHQKDENMTKKKDHKTTSASHERSIHGDEPVKPHAGRTTKDGKKPIDGIVRKDEHHRLQSRKDDSQDKPVSTSALKDDVQQRAVGSKRTYMDALHKDSSHGSIGCTNMETHQRRQLKDNIKEAESSLECSVKRKDILQEGKGNEVLDRKKLQKKRTSSDCVLAADKKKRKEHEDPVQKNSDQVVKKRNKDLACKKAHERKSSIDCTSVKSTNDHKKKKTEEKGTSEFVKVADGIDHKEPRKIKTPSMTPSKNKSCSTENAKKLARNNTKHSCEKDLVKDSSQQKEAANEKRKVTSTSSRSDHKNTSDSCAKTGANVANPALLKVCKEDSSKKNREDVIKMPNQASNSKRDSSPKKPMQKIYHGFAKNLDMQKKLCAVTSKKKRKFEDPEQGDTSKMTSKKVKIATRGGTSDEKHNIGCKSQDEVPNSTKPVKKRTHVNLSESGSGELHHLKISRTTVDSKVKCQDQQMLKCKNSEAKKSDAKDDVKVCEKSSGVAKCTTLEKTKHVNKDKEQAKDRRMHKIKQHQRKNLTDDKAMALPSGKDDPSSDNIPNVIKERSPGKALSDDHVTKMSSSLHSTKTVNNSKDTIKSRSLKAKKSSGPLETEKMPESRSSGKRAVIPKDDMHDTLSKSSDPCSHSNQSRNFKNTSKVISKLNKPAFEQERESTRNIEENRSVNTCKRVRVNKVGAVAETNPKEHGVQVEREETNRKSANDTDVTKATEENTVVRESRSHDEPVNTINHVDCVGGQNSGPEECIPIPTFPEPECSPIKHRAPFGPGQHVDAECAEVAMYSQELFICIDSVGEDSDRYTMYRTPGTPCLDERVPDEDVVDTKLPTDQGGSGYLVHHGETGIRHQNENGTDYNGRHEDKRDRLNSSFSDEMIVLDDYLASDMELDRSFDDYVASDMELDSSVEEENTPIICGKPACGDAPLSNRTVENPDNSSCQQSNITKDTLPPRSDILPNVGEDIKDKERSVPEEFASVQEDGSCEQGDSSTQHCTVKFAGSDKDDLINDQLHNGSDNCDAKKGKTNSNDIPELKNPATCWNENTNDATLQQSSAEPLDETVDSLCSTGVGVEACLRTTASNEGDDSVTTELETYRNSAKEAVSDPSGANRTPSEKGVNVSLQTIDTEGKVPTKTEPSRSKSQDEKHPEPRGVEDNRRDEAGQRDDGREAVQKHVGTTRTGCAEEKSHKESSSKSVTSRNYERESTSRREDKRTSRRVPSLLDTREDRYHGFRSNQSTQSFGRPHARHYDQYQSNGVASNARYQNVSPTMSCRLPPYQNQMARVQMNHYDRRLELLRQQQVYYNTQIGRRLVPAADHYVGYTARVRAVGFHPYSTYYNNHSSLRYNGGSRSSFQATEGVGSLANRWAHDTVINERYANATWF